MNFKFSGHETFPCRYSWLPKAVNLIKMNGELLSDDEVAIVELGIGRNMVKALRFWIQAMGVATTKGKEYQITDFGEIIFGEKGVDRFLEDRRTLWLLHWNLMTQPDSSLFAWDFLFNRWNQPNILPNEVLQSFERETIKLERKLSEVTLKQHFNIFLHTYVPTQGKKGDIVEDNLDCPLVELELIEPVGEKQIIDGTNKYENIYAFRLDSKPDITSDLFIYCLYDYLMKNKPNENEITFREIHTSPNCLGQVFKLQETDLRERLDHIKEDSEGLFDYKESAQFQKVFCSELEGKSRNELLIKVFKTIENEIHLQTTKMIEQSELALAE